MNNQNLMESVLSSTQPKWCELIASGKKTVEIRKTIPKLPTPFKVYIYESLGKRIVSLVEVPGCGGGIFIDGVKYEGRGKVIGEFICDRIDTYEMEGYNKLENVYQAIKRIEVDEMTYDTYQYIEATNEMSQAELAKSSLLKQSCLTFDEIGKYVCGKKEFGFHTFYGWHISDLVIYVKPKDLNEFKQCHKCKYSESCIEHEYSCDGTHNLKRAPQSWCYVTEVA